MRTIASFLLLVITSSAAAQKAPLPVIDMHLHANRADANGPPPLAICAPGVGYPPLDPARSWPETFIAWLKNPQCKDPVWGPETDDALMRESLLILEKRNVIGVTSGPLLDRWIEAGGDRILPALRFNFGPGSPSPAEVRALLSSGKYVAFAEVAIQYNGVSPSDERFEPYLAVAEELDVPMGIHIGTGPPGAPYLGMKDYRARLHSALVLEDALLRHPKLRVWVMHAGWPMLDDMLALMWAHPQVHVDTGALVFALPLAEFHRYLRRLVEAGFGKRVMFGSDQMNWPGAIGRSIDAIESAEFLTAEQKRDILYGNAARFLRLGETASKSPAGRSPGARSPGSGR